MTVALIIIVFLLECILVGIIYRHITSRKHRLNGTTMTGEHDWMSPYR